MTNCIDSERSLLDFSNIVVANFSFLDDIGFKEIEKLPTLVKYRKDDIEVDVCHGHRSFEIRVEIAHGQARYSLLDFIEAADAQEARKFYTPTASTRAGVVDSVVRLAALTKQFCIDALSGDTSFCFSSLDINKKMRMENYWLEMNARHVRPQAHEAFRLGKYREAAELYKKIFPLLTPAELKKLAMAETRGKEQ